MKLTRKQYDKNKHQIHVPSQTFFIGRVMLVFGFSGFLIFREPL